MSFIKGYFAPVKAAKDQERRQSVMLEKRKTMMLEDKRKTLMFSDFNEKDAISEESDSDLPKIRAPAALVTSFLYPTGDFRNNAKEDLLDIKCDVMVNWLYQQQMEMLWAAGSPDEGVVLKKTRGQYTCCPADIMDEPMGFYKNIEMLNVRVGTLYPRALTTLLTSYRVP